MNHEPALPQEALTPEEMLRAQYDVLCEEILLKIGTRGDLDQGLASMKSFVREFGLDPDNAEERLRIALGAWVASSGLFFVPPDVLAAIPKEEIIARQRRMLCVFALWLHEEPTPASRLIIPGGGLETP